MIDEDKAVFHGFKLDRFQIEAIKSIEANHSVVVSAATGTGKTLIADYVIDKYLKEGRNTGILKHNMEKTM